MTSFSLLINLANTWLTRNSAESVIQRVNTLVTRLPKAPFLTLLILDLNYAFCGIGLTIIALQMLAFGLGVRDGQARQSATALVAECFEDPLLGDDATKTNDLFTERRGLATRRVAISRRIGGGRRYRQTELKTTVES